MQLHWHLKQHIHHIQLPRIDVLPLQLPRGGGHANPMACQRLSSLHCKNDHNSQVRRVWNTKMDRLYTKPKNLETSKEETLSLPYINGSFFRRRTRWWCSITRFIRLRITWTKLKQTQYTHTDQSRDTIAQKYSSIKVTS